MDRYEICYRKNYIVHFYFKYVSNTIDFYIKRVFFLLRQTVKLDQAQTGDGNMHASIPVNLTTRTNNCLF